MKRILLASLWLSLASYCALTTIVGPSGVISMRSANMTAARMKDNLETLTALHDSYSLQWDSLRTGTEAVSLEARSLGYISSSEIAVRLPIAIVETTPPSAGERIAYKPSIMMTDARIKRVSVAIAPATAALMMLFHLLKTRKTVKRQREILVQAASRT